MTDYTYETHLAAAIKHLRQANVACQAGEFSTMCEEMIAARASITRSIVMLPKPETFDDAA